MSRIVLADNFDLQQDQSKFLLMETLRKFDAALSRLDDDVQAIGTEEGNVRIGDIVEFPVPRFEWGTSSQQYTSAQYGRVGMVYTGNNTGYPLLSIALFSTLAGAYRDYGAAYTSNGAALGGNVTLQLRFLTSIPEGFSSFDATAIRLRYGMNLTGISGGASASVSLLVYDPVTGSSLGTITNTHSESGGTIVAAYGESQYVAAKRGDIVASWRPGAVLTFIVQLSIPRTHNSGSQFQIGRLEINWR